MLGFWIIITHLAGAYLTSSEFIQNKAISSSIFALGSSVLYMIPFIIFLPASPLSLLAVLVFRFLVVRFGLVDYLIWVRNLLAPADQRVHRLVRNKKFNTDSATLNQIVSIHVGSIAVHCIIISLAIILL